MGGAGGQVGLNSLVKRYAFNHGRSGVISHSLFVLSWSAPGGLYTRIILSWQLVVLIEKAQNWLKSICKNLSVDKICTPSFAYTSSPPPTPFPVSLLSLLSSVSIVYPGIRRAAPFVLSLHQVSVNKIISGCCSTVTISSSFILFWIL